MVVVNFFAGPGAGKSTAAANLFTKLKNEGVRTELAREVAKDFIWEGRSVQLTRNQLLIFANQYARLKDLEANGCDVAISDSPLLLSCSYGRTTSYYKELYDLVQKINKEFTNVNVWVSRVKPYQAFGRSQTAAEAVQIDSCIVDLVKGYDFVTIGTENDQNEFAANFVERYKRGEYV